MTKQTIKEQILHFMENQKEKLFNGRNCTRLEFRKSSDFKILVQTIAQMEREKSVSFNKKAKSCYQ